MSFFSFKIISGVRARAESYEIWVDKVKEALEAKGDERLDFDDIKELLEESQGPRLVDAVVIEDSFYLPLGILLGLQLAVPSCLKHRLIGTTVR